MRRVVCRNNFPSFSASTFISRKTGTWCTRFLRTNSSGPARFRKLIDTAIPDLNGIRKPIQILGTINPYCALLAARAGAQALYLSGSGVATASHGIPDIGAINLNDVIADVQRITDATDLPLLVDIDTGFGSLFNIARTIRHMERARAAAVHIEDQVLEKRCGHLHGKRVVSIDEMCDRINAAVQARTDPNFTIMARTDAFATEGIDRTIERCLAYVAAGADMIFPEALVTLDDYKKFSIAMAANSPKRDIPILANITEFGKNDLWTRDELGANGVSMILYPLSAHRAMSKTALTTYQHIINDGTQKKIIPFMETRAERYDTLGYDINKKKSPVKI